MDVTVSCLIVSSNLPANVTVFLSSKAGRGSADEAAVVSSPLPLFLALYLARTSSILTLRSSLLKVLSRIISCNSVRRFLSTFDASFASAATAAAPDADPLAGDWKPWMLISSIDSRRRFPPPLFNLLSTLSAFSDFWYMLRMELALLLLNPPLLYVYRVAFNFLASSLSVKVVMDSLLLVVMTRRDGGFLAPNWTLISSIL